MDITEACAVGLRQFRNFCIDIVGNRAVPEDLRQEARRLLDEDYVRRMKTCREALAGMFNRPPDPPADQAKSPDNPTVPSNATSSKNPE